MRTASNPFFFSNMSGSKHVLHKLLAYVADLPGNHFLFSPLPNHFLFSQLASLKAALHRTSADLQSKRAEVDHLVRPVLLILG